MGNTSSHTSHGSTPRAHGSSTPSGPNATSSASPNNSSSSRHRALSLSHLVPSSSQPVSASSSTTHFQTPSTPPLLVSGGHLSPQGPSANAIVSSQGLEGVVPGTPGAGSGYNVAVVKQLILEKKLAPFYRGLDDYEESWEDDEVARALRKSRELNKTGVVDPSGQENATGSNSTNTGSIGSRFAGFTSTRHQATVQAAVATIPQNERELREARAYRGAVECPICFLYYPPNINTSRCCQQPICTDCFVQMKRAEPTLQHLESEPACCPFCVEADFGVIYEVGKIVPQDETVPIVSSLGSELSVQDPRPLGESLRRKSVSHKSKEVVTIDEIRPDWEEKLNAVKAQAARRASRRIIMQRVGDRLIPVGYTSSRNPVTNDGDLGPILTTAEEEAIVGGSRGSRRSGRRGGSAGEASGMTGPDLEELMIMEAMRLSMIDHEEHQRKEAEAKKKREAEEARMSAALASNSGEGPSTASRGRNLVASGQHDSAQKSATLSHGRDSGPSDSQGGTPSRTSDSSRRSSDPATTTVNPSASSPARKPTGRPDLMTLESTDSVSPVRQPESDSPPPLQGYARLEDD